MTNSPRGVEGHARRPVTLVARKLGSEPHITAQAGKGSGIAGVESCRGDTYFECRSERAIDIAAHRKGPTRWGCERYELRASRLAARRSAVAAGRSSVDARRTISLQGRAGVVRRYPYADATEVVGSSPTPAFTSDDGLGIHKPRSTSTAAFVLVAQGRARDRAICPAIIRFTFCPYVPSRCGDSARLQPVAAHSGGLERGAGTSSAQCGVISLLQRRVRSRGDAALPLRRSITWSAI